MQARSLALGLCCAALCAAPAAGQTLPDLLDAMRRGGGWVDIPIEGGAGTLLTDAVPTGGLRLRGCMQVWGGHSGRWDIRARDVRDRGRLDVSVVPGQRVPFDYRTGWVAQLDVAARWSEPRDTTLLVWVGLGGGGASSRDPCEPIYGEPVGLREGTRPSHPAAPPAHPPSIP